MSTVFFALILHLAPPVSAAAPWFLMVYGDGLVEPVIIADWHENHQFLLATSDPISVPSTELAGRPYFSLALFWGPEWVYYVENGVSLATLRPEQANQWGQFFPAYGSRQALLYLSTLSTTNLPARQATQRATQFAPTQTPSSSSGKFARRADPLAAEVLMRHGIPAGPIDAPVGAGLTRGAQATLPITFRP